MTVPSESNRGSSTCTPLGPLNTLVQLPTAPAPGGNKSPDSTSGRVVRRIAFGIGVGQRFIGLWPAGACFSDLIKSAFNFQCVFSARKISPLTKILPRDIKGIGSSSRRAPEHSRSGGNPDANLHPLAPGFSPCHYPLISRLFL